MLWLFLGVVVAVIVILAVALHSAALFLLAGVMFFGGLFIYDAMEAGTDNEFLRAIVKWLEEL